jgi:signal transduction histidine kinase
MRWSLRTRFLLVLIALMLAVFVAIIVLIVRQNTNTLRNNLITESKSFAALATQPIGNAYETYNESGTIRIEQEIENFTDLDHDINQVGIINTNARQLFSTNTTNPIKVSATDAIAVTPTYIHSGNGNLVAIVEPYVESYGIHRYNVVYGISYQSVNQSIDSIVTSIIALSAGILLLSLLAWYFLINRLFLQPIARVSRIALLISKGEFNQQIHLERSDEIGDLANAVDTMASSLKADITKLKNTDQLKSEFLMIIAHNLRTPLTVIAGYIDTLKIAADPGQILHDHVGEISANVTRLGHFAEDALTISTMEEGQTSLHRDPLEMAPILQGVADEFTSLAAQKKLKFSMNIKTSAWVSLSKPYFHSALWNLLDNAYKFTPEAGAVELSAITRGNNLEITVKDSGIGIKESEVPKLFTKFHRATDTLTYNYEGTGIGLYLSKLIVEQHDGSISVETTEGAGSTFTMRLPIVSPPSTDNSKPLKPDKPTV